MCAAEYGREAAIRQLLAARAAVDAQNKDGGSGRRLAVQGLRRRGPAGGWRADRGSTGTSADTGTGAGINIVVVFFIFSNFPERRQTSKTTTFWRLQNATDCQNVVPMGTTFRQNDVF